MVPNVPRLAWLFLVGTTLLSSAGCQKTYYTTMEKFGVHKRDILADRVEEARDSQNEAKDQFESALARFQAVVGDPGGELKDKYDQLKDELEKSETKAKKVRERIASVEDVAEALFQEWEVELAQYSNEKLRASSKEKLKATRKNYAGLMAAMKKAESRIDPVLTPLRDQVLYLKHNLNAQAIAALQDELVEVEADVQSLIQEMEAAIKEADAFIQELAKG